MLQDAEFALAMHNVEKLWQDTPQAQDSRTISTRPIAMLGEAIKHIDDLVQFVDAFADVREPDDICISSLTDLAQLHPFFKTAWTMLLAIYNVCVLGMLKHMHSQ